MKRIIYLFSIAFLVFSCSDDDSGNNELTPQENLIGSWTLSQEFENGEEEELQSCNELFTLTFSSDTRTQTDFVEDDLGVCVFDETLVDTYAATDNMITFFLNELTIENEDDDREITLAYSIEDSVLTFELGDFRAIYIRVEE